MYIMKADICTYSNTLCVNNKYVSFKDIDQCSKLFVILYAYHVSNTAINDMYLDHDLDLEVTSKTQD